MTRIAVPFHLTERVPDLDLPVPTDITVDADVAGGSATWPALIPVYEAVAAAVAEVAAGGGRPDVYSGDCTVALGTVAGLQRAGLDPAVVWFDAHGDVQTMETTTSGFLGGMPLRLLVGYRPELVATPLGLRPVAEERVVLVGARDLDPPEAQYLREARIVRSTVDELQAGVLPAGPLYLHLDMDVVDPGDLPGLRYPVPDGPSLPAVGRAASRVLATGRVVAVGIACTWYGGHAAADRVRADLEAALA